MAAAPPPSAPGTEGQLLAAGLYQLLSPVVEECDARIQEVMDSQAQLSQQIETLAADLDHFMTFTQTPPLAAHLQRLLNSRNRLVTINTTLLTIMNRLDRIAAGVDPAAKDTRKLSLGGLFKKKDSQNVPQPTQQVTTPQSIQPTPIPTSTSTPITPEQPLQQLPQETKNDTTQNDAKVNSETKSEPQKEVSNEPGEQK